MAKDDKKTSEAQIENTEEEETSAGGKIAIFFATLVIIAIWAGILILLVKWDVGGFGSNVMYPILKDVPYVNKILPKVVEETDYSKYPYTTLAEANEYVDEREAYIAELNLIISQKDEEIEELTAKVNKLSVYEANEEAYEKLKKKFDEEVVFSDVAPDISVYREYYEGINPENAEEIYRQVISQQLTDEELEDYVRTYSSMKAKNAAAIFDTMTGQLSLVAQILENMDTQSRADIMAAMNTDVAAKLTSIMNPN